MMKVFDYKKHPLFPFADFRTNDASFLLLELFWTQVAREALGEELSQQCRPLQKCERDDGPEPFYNPLMIDFWIPEMRRGVKVVLQENFDNSVLRINAKGKERFQCYDPFGFHGQYRGVTGPDDEIEQIVFGSDLQDDSIQSTQNGMRAFLIDKISLEEVDRLVDEQLKRTNYPTPEEWEQYYDELYPDDDL